MSVADSQGEGAAQMVPSANSSWNANHPRIAYKTTLPPETTD